MEAAKTTWDLIQGKINEGLAIVIMSIVSALIIYFRKLPSLIKHKTERKLIIHDLEKHAKAFSITQDLVDEVGAIYGHGIFYHNHGPEKMTVMFECLGHSCGECITKCRNYRQIKRLQSSWINRPIQAFWLNNLCLRTLKLEGKINTVKYDDCDDWTKGVFDATGIHTVKEVFIKTKSTSEFITLSVSFCERLSKKTDLNPLILDAANKLNRLL